jgi:hypothetical protein
VNQRGSIESPEQGKQGIHISSGAGGENQNGREGEKRDIESRYLELRILHVWAG